MAYPSFLREVRDRHGGRGEAGPCSARNLRRHAKGSPRLVAPWAKAMELKAESSWHRSQEPESAAAADPPVPPALISLRFQREP
jgi:hypothetical protein